MSFTSKNNYEEKSMNTRGVEFYNSDASFDPSMLSLGFWNNLTQIKINPAIAEKQRTENGPKYDKDTYGMVSLPVQKVHVLLKAIVEQLLPTMVSDPGKVPEVGFAHGDKYVGVGNGIKYTGEVRPYVVIYDIDKETGKATAEICYEFRSYEYALNFDQTTGTYVVAKRHAELELFVVFLDEAVKAATNATTHAIRNTNKWYTEKQDEKINKIMTALNIPVESSGSGSGNKGMGGRQVNGGGFSSSRDSNVSSAPITDATSFDDIEKELGAMH